MREIVDLIWEAVRWRRHLAAFLETATSKAMARTLQPLVENDPAVVGSHGTSFMGKVRALQTQPDAGRKLADDWMVAIRPRSSGSKESWCHQV